MSRKSWRVRRSHTGAIQSVTLNGVTLRGINAISHNGHVGLNGSARPTANQPKTKCPNPKTHINQFGTPYEKQLWHLYCLSDKKHRGYYNALFSHYEGFLRSEINTFIASLSHLGLSLSPDDIAQDATIGMLKAIQKFDLSKNVRFEVYARTRIRGSIVDGLRRMQHFPRIVSKQKRIIKPMMDSLRSKLNYNPTTEDFCQEYGEEYRPLVENKLVFSQVYNSSSAVTEEENDDVVFGFLGRGKKHRSSDSSMRRSDLINLIFSVLDNHEQRSIIVLYYFGHKTNRTIGRILNISPSNVVLKHKQALELLKSPEISKLLKKELQP